jgi:predicted nucleotidyltransferase
MDNNISQQYLPIVKILNQVSGIEAIVLGGSRARGTYTLESDVDLGLYYHPTAPIDTKQLNQIATEMDDDHRKDLVTEPGGWGPWINGGGWLTIQGQAVDLIYRDLYKVTRVILEALDGRFEMAYQPGHPQGFPSYIYLSEVALCIPLWEPHNTIRGLKLKTSPYPPRLKHAIIDRFWWEAGFSLKNAQKSIKTGDVAYAAGCCFRCVACLAQTLFAVNEQYWMNEKGALSIAAGFKSVPDGLDERVATAFELLNRTPEGIAVAIETLQKLLEECNTFLS